jgi:hypothetical protein
MQQLFADLAALPPMSKEERHEYLWSTRTKRLGRLLALKAPEVIIERECLQILAIRGLYRNVWEHWYGKVRLEVWYWAKCWFWWKIVCRKTEEEMDELIR